MARSSLIRGCTPWGTAVVAVVWIGRAVSGIRGSTVPYAVTGVEWDGEFGWCHVPPPYPCARNFSRG